MTLNSRELFIAGCVMSFAGVTLGIVAVTLFGGTLPAWLLSAELIVILAAALIYGFTGARLPSIAPWLSSRPIQGASLVCLGVAVTFVPLQFIFAALLIGAGTRLVWRAACDLEKSESRPDRDGPAGGAARSTGPIVVNERDGEVVTTGRHRH
jgi:hypothetical protein